MKTLLLASFIDQLPSWMNIHDWKDLLFMIIIGAVAGMLAEFLVGSKGLGMIITIIVGIIGSWLGNKLFGSYLNFTNNSIINLIISSTAGAIILVIILSLIFRLRARDRTDYRA